MYSIIIVIHCNILVVNIFNETCSLFLLVAFRSFVSLDIVGICTGALLLCIYTDTFIANGGNEVSFLLSLLGFT